MAVTEIQISPATTGTLIFLKRLDLYSREKPYYIHVPASAVPESKFTNEEDEVMETMISDMRQQQSSFNIDINGFEVINLPPVLSHADFSDKTKVETIFLPKIKEEIKEKLGASNVWVYDWKIRRRSAQFPTHSRGGNATAPQPAQGVHVDFKPESLLPFMQKQMSEGEMEKLLGARLQAINIWRPLFGPLKDWPLAICDYSSFDIDDLVPVDHVYPDRVEETYSVFSNAGQRWYFLRDHRPDEAIMFKTYDSDLSVARCAPHASFALKDTPKNAKLRESIEVRFFVSYYEEDQASNQDAH